MPNSLPLPPVLRIEPASACNLKCSHCPTGVFKMARTIMKPEVFEIALRELRNNVPPIRSVVLYHGGEPFLNKHFLSMIPRVKAVGGGIHLKTVSNAMLIKPEMCEAIVTSGLDAIEFSMDGESPEENDTIRVTADFQHISRVVHEIARIKRQLNHPIKISVATTQFQKLVDFDHESSAPVPSFLRNAFADVEDLIDYKATWAMQWPSEKPDAGYDILWDDRARLPVTSCSLIDDTITIRADGSVVPCCFDLTSLAVMGNIKEQSLSDIWNGGPYNEFRTKFATGDHPQLCKGCVVVTGDKFLLHRDGKKEDPVKRIPMSALSRPARRRA